VIRNAPLLDDGTPMPTRYWLIDRASRAAVDRLEAEGGVRAAEAAVDSQSLAAAHARVKCLHAHYAWYLAGGDDPVGRWVADRLGRPAAGAVAALDCGTNSTRLLVAGPTGETIVRLMRITRLGRGVDRDRRLDPAAIERTVAVLRDYRAVMDSQGVQRVRMTATSAARDAANREDFFAAATDAVGVRPELLTGEEEGRLSFRGATAELDPAGAPWLVADIGGGSTELIVGSDPAATPAAVTSLDVGCVRLSERFLLSDPPAPDELAAVERQVGDMLETARARQPALGTADTLVGLAGTVAALAAIDQGLETYDRDRVHHYVLSRQTVERLLGDLAGESTSARRRRPGVEADRADVIVGGTLVLAGLMRHFGFEACLTSEADILDGLASTLLVP
jgi:exopolyphosphatase/guanosine-5'-triphosphate,3'-diphosphate pyrophosphatase